MWDREQFNKLRFGTSHKYFKDAKANKQKYKMKLNLNWKVKLNQPQKNRDLKQNVLHLSVQIWWF